MKKITFIALLAFIAMGVLAVSCNEEEKEIADGKIGLQQADFQFDYLEEDFATFTEGEDWYFSAVVLNDEEYKLSEKEQGTVFEKTVEWLTFRRDGKEIFGKVAEMPEEDALAGKRTFRIVLRSGSNEEVITGTQEMLCGRWKDNIGLSQKEVTFPKSGGSADIKTEKGMNWWFYGVAVGDEFFSMHEQGELTYTFANDWLSFSKTADGVHISVKENATGADRIFQIQLQSGDFFARIDGVQLAD